MSGTKPRCSLCDVTIAWKGEMCIRCGKAFAAGEKLGRALERERCAMQMESNGNITSVIVGMRELAAQIRSRIVKDSTS